MREAVITVYADLAAGITPSDATHESRLSPHMTAAIFRRIANDLVPPRFCDAPFPWLAGVRCIRVPHGPDTPHKLAADVAKRLGVDPAWPGNL